MTILATMYESAGDYDQPWDKDVHFVISSNSFTDFNMRVYCGNMFEVIGHRWGLRVYRRAPVCGGGRV